MALAKNDDSGRPVLIERERNVLVVTINRPSMRNAIDAATHSGIGLALEEADRDPWVRVVVITGAGDQSFCAGADLKALSRGESVWPDDPHQQAWGFAGYVRHVINKPTIAAVNGTALGGGTEIVLASDLALATENATFGLPEVKRGIFASAGGAIRLPQQVPDKIAMEMLLTGESITASRALAIGLINAVVPVGKALESAMALAGRIAANAPLSVQATKRIAKKISAGGLEKEASSWSQNEVERAAIRQSADAKEGIAAFAEKREPRWTGT